MAMSEEQKAELEKVDKRIKFLTNLRLGIMFIALFDVLIIVSGDQFAEGAGWLVYFKASSYNILGIAITVILVTVIMRMFLVAKHNSIVRKSRD